MRGRPSTLLVFIDVICPWCYVGKRRMEKALAMLGGEAPMRIAWLPFELNPDMPKEGLERRLYRIRKFGSWENAQRLDAQLTQIGAEEGIPFRFDLIGRTPNTLNAHRVIWFARMRAGSEHALVEALFSAYFTQGRDIGDSEVLADIAAGAGLEPHHVFGFLASAEGTEEVLQQEAVAKRAGLSGVPAFVLDSRPLLIGAHPPQAIASALREAIASRAPPLP